VRHLPALNLLAMFAEAAPRYTGFRCIRGSLGSRRNWAAWRWMTATLRNLGGSGDECTPPGMWPLLKRRHQPVLTLPAIIQPDRGFAHLEITNLPDPYAAGLSVTITCLPNARSAASRASKREEWFRSSNRSTCGGWSLSRRPSAALVILRLRISR